MGEALEAKGGWYHITLGTTFSDHYPVVGHFQLHRKWGLFQPRIPPTIYTVIEVKEQLSNQWSLLVEDSSTSDKLLAKLMSRASFSYMRLSRPEARMLRKSDRGLNRD